MCNPQSCKIKKPKGSEEKSDMDLTSREEKDMFWIRRIFRFFILGLVILIITYFTVITMWHIISHQNLFNELVRKVIDNIVVITCTAFSILGINFAYKK